MTTFRCWYVNLKPILVQARDRDEAVAEALRMIRTGYPFKVEKCEEVKL